MTKYDKEALCIDSNVCCEGAHLIRDLCAIEGETQLS